MIQPPALVRTPRLTLRCWTAGDAPALAAAVGASHAHLRPWMPWVTDDPVGLDGWRAVIEEFAQQRAAGGDTVYGTFAGDAVVGGTGLHRRRGPGVLEIGYWIHADHVRRGYATELAAALTDVAFSLPDVERVEIHHDRANTASRGVPERLGSAFAGEAADEVRAPAEAGVDCTWVVSRDLWGYTRRISPASVGRNPQAST